MTVKDLYLVFMVFILVITSYNTIVLKLIKMTFLKIKNWLEKSPDILQWIERELYVEKSYFKCWYCKYMVYSIILKLKSGITLRTPQKFSAFNLIILFVIAYIIKKEALIEISNRLKSVYDQIINHVNNDSSIAYGVIAERKAEIIGCILIMVILFYYFYGYIKKKIVKKIIEQMDEIYERCNENIHYLTIMESAEYIDDLVESITDNIGFKLQDGVLTTVDSRESGGIGGNQSEKRIKKVSDLLESIRECFQKELGNQFLIDNLVNENFVESLKKDELLWDSFWESEINKEIRDFFRENHKLIHKKKISGIRVVREDRIQNLDFKIAKVEEEIKRYRQLVWSYRAKNIFLKTQIQKKRGKIYLLFYIPNIFMRGINIYFYTIWNIIKCISRLLY